MLYICLLLLVIVLLFIGVDFYFFAKTVVSRLGIGSINDNAAWKQLIVQKSKKWLIRTPTIKVTDQNRLVLWDMLKGNYKRQAIQSWQQAALFLGIFAEWQVSKNPKEKELLDKFVAQNLLSKENKLKVNLKEVDDIMLLYALIIYLPKDNQYKPVFDTAYQFIVNMLVPNDDTVPYRRHVPFYKFVDTLGFICPFLMKYGTHYNQPEAIDLAYRQIVAYNRYGMYPHTLIPAHAYREDTKMPVGLFGWGRGIAWYAIGLIDSWLALDDSHHLKEKLSQLVEQYAILLIETQRENGTWGWYILEKTSRADSSSVAALSWFLTNAATLPNITEKANKAVALGISYLKTVTRKSGAIDFNQGDTKSIGVYSTHFDILPFAQGFTLRTIATNK